MNEKIQDSGAVAPEDLDLEEFERILDCTIEELLKKAYNEGWKVKHVEFWLKVKNAQNFELIEKYLNVCVSLCETKAGIP